MATRFWIHVVPGAKRTGLAGTHGDAIKLRVRAAAEDGKANAEVRALVAELLGVRTATVSIVVGETSRRKCIEVEDATALADLVRRAEALS